jgi:hypothetical protein
MIKKKEDYFQLLSKNCDDKINEEKEVELKTLTLTKEN